MGSRRRRSWCRLRSTSIRGLAAPEAWLTAGESGRRNCGCLSRDADAALNKCGTRDIACLTRAILAAMNAQPQGFPLRADVDTLRTANVTTFYRHCFHAANRAINPHETRAAVGPASTTGAAGPTSWPRPSSPISWHALVPLSAGARLLTAAPRVDLSGVGSLLFPRRSGAISATAVPWVVEGDPAPVLQFVLESATLDSAKKLVGHLVLTSELMENTAGQRRHAAGCWRERRRRAGCFVVHERGGTTSRPAGILNGVAALTAATAGAGAMTTELSRWRPRLRP